LSITCGLVFFLQLGILILCHWEQRKRYSIRQSLVNGELRPCLYLHTYGGRYFQRMKTGHIFLSSDLPVEYLSWIYRHVFMAFIICAKKENCLHHRQSPALTIILQCFVVALPVTE
jgi:hypothetical protein